MLPEIPEKMGPQQNLKLSVATTEDENNIVATLDCAFGGLVKDGLSASDAVGGWTDEIAMFHGPRARIAPYELPLIHQGDENKIFYKLVDVSTGKLVGTVAAEFRNENEAFIRYLSVLPAYQAKGIGSYLLSAAEEWLHEKKAKIITLSTVTGRDSLIDYYAKRGYVDTGERPLLQEHPGDKPVQTRYIVIMKKQVVP